MLGPLNGGTAIDATTAGPPEFIAIGDAPVTVGRSAGAALRLADPGVSRRHATLSRVAGGLAVEDHDGRFGTTVNGTRIRTALLRPGDRVLFGPAVAYRVEAGGLRLDAAAWGSDLVAVGLSISAPTRGDPAGVAGLRRPLVEGIGFRIRPDTFVGILGPSGAGKSTVLHCLAGYLAPDRGRLLFDGGRDALAEPDAYRASLGHVPQDDIVDRTLTVRENLRHAARLRLGGEASPGDVAAAVADVLGRVALGDHGEKPAGALSGGQRKRLGVAFELLRRPRLLLMDEPTSGLDPAGEARLMEQLRLVARRGTTVVCTTHLMDNLRLLDEVIVLGVVDGIGRVAYAGPPDGLLAHFGRRQFADLYEDLASGRFSPVDAPPEVGPFASDPASQAGRQTGTADSPIVEKANPVPPAEPAWRQFPIVARRLFLILAGDRWLLAAMLAQPALLGLLVALTQYDLTVNEVATITFFAAVVAIWLGLNNAARDLVRDRRHYVRDRLAGLGPGAYLAARATVHAAAGVAQVAILMAVLLGVGGMALPPEVAAAQRAATGAGLAAVLMLAYLGGVGLGLLVSALARTEEAAVAVLPLLIMPQLLLSAVAAGVQHKSHGSPRPFRPIVVTLKSEDRILGPAALVDLGSMLCLSRPATLVAEAPAVKGYGRWTWLGDLCHLLILLLAIWTLVLVTFRRAERRWLRLVDLG